METAIFERELPPLDSSPVSALPPSVDDFAAEVPPSERESPFDSDPGDALPAALRGGPLAEAEREERVVSALETPIPGRVRELLPFELDDAAEAERVLSARSSSPNLVPEAPTPRAPKTSSANLSALRPPTPPVSRPSIKSLPAVAPPPPSAAKAAASPGEGAVPAKASPDGSVAIAKAPPAPRPSAKSPTPPAPSVRPSAAPEAAPFASLERPASIPPPAAPAARALDSAFLASVRGLEDLPEEAHAELVARAARRRLELDEEVGAFAVAVVLSGSVSVLPAVSDLACARVGSGEVVFTQGTLEAAVALRIVATAPGTEVAVWEQAALDAAVADCPWVADDLATIADRFQALAGATMGVFGERLDDVMFGEISARCALRALSEGELLFEQGKEVGGLAIVGVGRLSLLDGEAETAELGPGDLVFPAELMGHQPAPWSARAGAGGALLLFAERRVAHELMVSVPPLLEVLAS
jgi:hypothetical protein